MYGDLLNMFHLIIRYCIVGTKRAMEVELSSLEGSDCDDNGDDNSDADLGCGEEVDASPEIQIQASVTKKAVRNGRAQSVSRLHTFIHTIFILIIIMFRLYVLDYLKRKRLKKTCG